MATWEDGPEYAPLERPEEFRSAELPPLEVVEHHPLPAPNAPVARPAFSPSEGDSRPLAILGTPPEDRRDPRTSFQVATAALTTISVGQVRPDWTPDQPLGTSGPIDAYIPPWQHITPGAQINAPLYPQPGTPQWFAPPEAAPEQVQPTATIKRVFQAVTIPVLVCLLLGGLIQVLSPLLLLLSFLLSTRIRYRITAVRQVYAACAVLVTLVAATQLMYVYSLDLLFDSVAAVCQPLCWIVLLALTIISYLAVSKNERPSGL
jgi:hypothetical protein